MNTTLTINTESVQNFLAHSKLKEKEAQQNQHEFLKKYQDTISAIETSLSAQRTVLDQQAGQIQKHQLEITCNREKIKGNEKMLYDFIELC